MATLYKANNEKVAINRKKAFSMKELQKFVGGYFELISLGDNYLVVNEEAILMGLPLNENASRITAQFGYVAIYGDALFTEKRLVK